MEKDLEIKPNIAPNPLAPKKKQGEEEIVKPQSETEGLKQDLKKLNEILGVIVLVLLIGFMTLLFALGAMLIDSWNSKQQSYQNLQNQIYQLNEQKRQRR